MNMRMIKGRTLGTLSLTLLCCSFFVPFKVGLAQKAVVKNPSMPSKISVKEKKTAYISVGSNGCELTKATWKISNKSIAKINPKFKDFCIVSALKPGTAKVSVVLNYKMEKKSKKKTLTTTVTVKKVYEEAQLKFSDDGKTVIGCSNKSDAKYAVIPDGVTSIGEQAFSGCTKLEKVTMPEGLNVIGSKAFLNCGKLVDINIPDGVLEIQDRAFDSCSNLVQVELPNSIEKYGKGIFNCCESLKIVKLPDGIKEIPKESFCYCSKLEEINFPSSLERINKKAFYNCGIKKLLISSSITYIDSTAFEDCFDLNEIIVNDNNDVYDSRENCNAVVRKDNNVLIVGSNTTVIPTTVEEIGDYAFEGRRMQQISIPGNVRVIGIQSFSGCEQLEDIKIEDGLEKISRCAFSDCYKLKELSIPESVVSVGKGVFLNAGLTTIVWPSSVEDIPDSAFWMCSNLKTITLQKGVQSIEEEAFYDCNKLEKIEFPDTLRKIGNEAFAMCGQLNDISWSANIEEIGSGAFSKCPIQSLVLPEHLKVVGKNVFQGCKKLSKVNLSGELKTIGEGMFSDCTKLSSIEIAEGVENIDDYAFNGCSNLQDIKLPNSLKIIEGDVIFAGCKKLEAITIPDEIEKINDDAFLYCSNLKEFVWKGKTYHYYEQLLEAIDDEV